MTNGIAVTFYKWSAVTGSTAYTTYSTTVFNATDYIIEYPNAIKKNSDAESSPNQWNFDTFTMKISNVDGSFNPPSDSGSFYASNDPRGCRVRMVVTVSGTSSTIDYYIISIKHKLSLEDELTTEIELAYAEYFCLNKKFDNIANIGASSVAIYNRTTGASTTVTYRYIDNDFMDSLYCSLFYFVRRFCKHHAGSPASSSVTMLSATSYRTNLTKADNYLYLGRYLDIATDINLSDAVRVDSHLTLDQFKGKSRRDMLLRYMDLLDCVMINEGHNQIRIWERGDLTNTVVQTFVLNNSDGDIIDFEIDFNNQDHYYTEFEVSGSGINFDGTGSVVAGKRYDYGIRFTSTIPQTNLRILDLNVTGTNYNISSLELSGTETKGVLDDPDGTLTNLNFQWYTNLQTNNNEVKQNIDSFDNSAMATYTIDSRNDPKKYTLNGEGFYYNSVTGTSNADQTLENQTAEYLLSQSSTTYPRDSQNTFTDNPVVTSLETTGALRALVDRLGVERITVKFTMHLTATILNFGLHNAIRVTSSVVGQENALLNFNEVVRINKIEYNFNEWIATVEGQVI